MSAALKLEVFHQGELMQEVPFTGDPLWLGRDPDCVIRLDDRAISRKHALIRSTGSGIEFEKKSKFGLARMDGRDVDAVLLKGGECLELGPFEIRVRKSEPVAPVATPDPVASAQDRAPEPTPHLQVQEVVISDEAQAFSPEGGEAVDSPFGEVDFNSQNANDAQEIVNSDQENQPQPEGSDLQMEVEAGSSTGQFDFASQSEDGATRILSAKTLEMKPVLEFRSGDGAGSVYEINDAEIAIGRSTNCHVVLEDKKSSRKHVVLKKKEGKVVLKDQGSSNGTLVNGERVDERELQSGDEIQVGDTRFWFKMVQGDYEAKKADFLNVPAEPIPEAPLFANPMPMSMESAPPAQDFNPFMQAPSIGMEAPSPTPTDFAAPEEDKRSFIGKFLDRYRAMPVKQQIIYMGVILAGVYFLMDEPEVEKKPKLQMGSAPAKVQKKEEKKKPSGPPTFDSLAPEQQRYVESEYQLSIEHFKNRDYDSCLLELGKIFTMVQDYKSAREMEIYAKEMKRKLEAQEEERKRKEQERQAQIKLQSLIDQAGLYMDQKKYKDAEGIFPEIELLQPDNSVVANWRKRIIEETEKSDAERKEKERIEKLAREAWAEYEAAAKILAEKKYFDALDRYDAILTREGVEPKLATIVKEDIKKAEDAIASERDPLVEQGKQFEREEKYSEAYKSYLNAAAVDPTDPEPTAGMNRIRGILNARAKSIYSEGVIAESFSELDVAEKRYREVLEVVPVDNDYFKKASSRLAKLTVLRRPASEGASK